MRKGVDTHLGHCNGKKMYDKRGAETNCNYRQKHNRRGRNYLRIYHCPDCNYWHITKKTDWSQPKWKKRR